ncbi:hypothetical protein SAMN05444410_1244 [Hydrobacter penzbergensis]|jgi:hypothetical protein|uniref:Lipocalin-like domain-containing protein n=1 Tax=Hydrobacter penzbergensis TaxID=1235997 RepID=A0A8X8IJ90_9BACT|nr:hypothetical protein [Hydrobacter penzbergensis]SDX66328.1 hypothetical protein SAMN05444410_1244 [Hydrobacter penzbergensis]
MTASCKIIASFFFCVLLLASCTKDDGKSVKPEDQLVKYLTGDAGNRVWRIREIYQNRVQTQLTANQLRYTKTYTQTAGQSYTGIFTDADGYSGKWTLTSVAQLVEVITNNPAGDIKTEWIINKLDANAMDVETTNNGTTTRVVYYGF